MSRNRAWLLGSVGLIVLILLAGWIVGIQPQLSQVTKTNQQRISVEAQNANAERQLIRLKRDYVQIEALKSQLSVLRISVPTSAAIPTFVTELNSLASTNHVTVKSINVTDARPYVPAAPAPAGSSGKGPSAAVTNAKINGTNFVLVPLQFSISGDYSDVLNFVRDLQIGPRLFLVSTFASTGATTTKGADSRNSTTSQQVDSTISGFIYVILNPAKQSK